MSRLLLILSCLLLAVGCSDSSDPTPVGRSSPSSSPEDPAPAAADPPRVGGPWMLAFAGERPGRKGLDIFTVKVPAGRPRYIAGIPRRDDFSPTISPDGRWVAFRRNPPRSDEGDIWLVAVGGGESVNLTESPGVADWSPTWSPSGNRIAYYSDRGGGMDVWIMEPDGSAKRRLTNDPGLDEYPTWSPDERQIAFNSHREGNFEIFVMASNGDNPVNLTNDPGEDQWPAWSPDGQWIAFVSDRDGSDDVFLMSPDGNDVRNLTNTRDLQESQPAWLPNGTLTFTRHGETGPISVWATSLVDGSERKIPTSAEPVFAYSWGPVKEK